ncbi:MAG: phenylalanine--tRNA ligase subunit beta [Acidobacteriia bacterium]|nr:phenylalanine--tRNA ligase subunit beta [Terriglobia bacterium]
MKISYQWLKTMVDVPVDAQKLAADLSMAGLPVESLESHGDEWIIELELTANRGDCLSHWGTAREVATLYSTPLKPIEIQFPESAPSVKDFAAVEILDADLCYRYCARVVTGVKVGPSPAWLVARLEALGQRSINNVADITNFVLMEMGHPLHAFDLDRLNEQRIVVRRARNGEHLTTLDGIDRTLNSENLVIADARRAVALAGVMGGADSEISAATKNVLIESAWFLPTSIRKTARDLGLHTEASHRFERGTDLENAVRAMNRCAQLIHDLAGGTIHKGFLDCYPTKPVPPQILLRQNQVRRHLGVDIDPAQVDRILEALHFEKVQTKGDGQVWLTPTWRHDVTREIDLIEEIARHYGYDKFPARDLGTLTHGHPLNSTAPVARLSERLRALGYFEIVTTTFLDPEEGALFSERTPVELANPLSEVAPALRTNALPSLIENVRRNIHRGQRDVRLFEACKDYSRKNSGPPSERQVLVFGATGSYREKGLHDTSKLYDLFAFRGDVEQAAELFEARERRFVPSRDPLKIYRPHQSLDLEMDGTPVGSLGSLADHLLDRYKIKQEVFVAEFDLDALLLRGLRKVRITPRSSYPAVERDISFVVPVQISFQQILQAVESAQGEQLTEVLPFDRYEHGSLGKGMYSLSLRLQFQSFERTLVEEEINAQVERVMKALEQQVKAVPRVARKES